jgi:hypothetical protein
MIRKIKMNISTPSLPSLRYVPIRLVIDSATGLLYGKLGQVNPLLTMTIFTIRGLADTLFYYLANTILEGKDLRSQKIFIGTYTAVNLTFLIVMRELNLIGRFFSCIIGLGMIGCLVNRVRYIQDQERHIQDDQVLDLDDI